MKKIKKAVIAGLTLTALAGVTACKSGAAAEEITDGISSEVEQVTLSETDNKKTYELSYTDNGSKAHNDYYVIDIPDVSISIDGNTGYMLDFDCRQAENRSRLEKKRDLSSFSAAVLVNADKHTLSELGLNDEHEKNMAVQYALWSYGKSTEDNDSQMTDSIFDLRNVRPTQDAESIERIKAAAEVLIDDSKNNPYYVAPKLNIEKSSSKSVRHPDDKYFIVGPYNMSASGFDIDSMSASVSCDYADCSIVDSEGKKIDRFENNQDIYVKVIPNDSIKNCEDTSKIDISVVFNTKGSAKVGSVLGTGEKGTTEYAALLDEEVDLTNNLHVTCPYEVWDVISGKKLDEYK